MSSPTLGASALHAPRSVRKKIAKPKEEENDNNSVKKPTRSKYSNLATGKKRKFDEDATETEAEATPKPRKRRWLTKPPTIVLDADPQNLPKTVKFEFKRNGLFNRRNPRLFRVNKPPKADILTFILIDNDKNGWKFTHPDTENQQWENKDWVSDLNTWYSAVLCRCFGKPILTPEKAVKTNEQWSSYEMELLIELVKRKLFRRGQKLEGKDWKDIARGIDIVCRGETLKEGSVLSSARGHSVTSTMPYTVSRTDRTMGSRTQHSLGTFIDRVEGKKRVEWMQEWLEDAEAEAEIERSLNVLEASEIQYSGEDEDDDGSASMTLEELQKEAEGDLASLTTEERQLAVEKEVARIQANPAAMEIIQTRSVLKLEKELAKIFVKAEAKEREKQAKELKEEQEYTNEEDDEDAPVSSPLGSPTSSIRSISYFTLP